METGKREALSTLLRSARERSREHVSSLPVLLENGNYGVAVALLRQEIDTFVRLVYLNAIGKHSALEMIEDFAATKRLRIRDGTKKRIISEREMVELAAPSYHWVEPTYRLSCNLIHFSTFHDYQSTDPFSGISDDDRRAIIKFLHDYHGYSDPDIDMTRFVRVLPNVMDKIARHVAGNCATLEQTFAPDTGAM